MKKKIGTILDEDLVFKAKEIALEKKQTFSQLLEEALKAYILSVEKSKARKDKNVSTATKGIMNISPKDLKQIMEEEGVYES